MQRNRKKFTNNQEKKISLCRNRPRDNLHSGASRQGFENIMIKMPKKNRGKHG